MPVHKAPRASAPTRQSSRADKAGGKGAGGPLMPSNAAALQRLAGNQAVTGAIEATGVAVQRQDADGLEDVEEHYRDEPAVQKPFRP